MFGFLTSLLIKTTGTIVILLSVAALHIYTAIDETVANKFVKVPPPATVSGTIPPIEASVASPLSSFAKEETEKNPIEPQIISPTPTSKIKPEISAKALEKSLSDAAAQVSKLSALLKKKEEPKTPAFEKNISSSIVNLYCTTKDSKGGHIITATGIIIDPKGIVLTNAHTAEYMLLGSLTDCKIRTGNPAAVVYNVKLLYISPQWVKENLTAITDENPTGTGELDYAFLAITSRAGSNEALPKEFHALTPEITPRINAGDNVQLAAYPASFLGASVISKDLYLVNTFAKVKEMFTFKEKTVDLFSMTGSITAQKGSSGGAVVDGNGNLIGIIVTATEEKTTDERQVRAITMSHVNSTIDPTFATSLKDLLAGNVREQIELFRTKFAPALSNILVDQLLSNKGQ